jgi:hypothetical protein
LQVAECVKNAFVDKGVVELVDPVVVEEELQRLMHKLFVVGIAEGAAHQHGGTVANVPGDDFGWQGLAVVFEEHGIDGVREVGAGVNEGAVEVEHKQAQVGGGYGAEDLHMAIFSETAAEKEKGCVMASAAPPGITLGD